MMQKVLSDRISFWWLLLGPALLLTAVCLGKRWDLALVSVCGVCFAARFGAQGFLYGAVPLFIGSIGYHFIREELFLWHLGLEVCIGTSLLITALCFEEGHKIWGNWSHRLEIQDNTITHLEELLAKEKEEEASAKILWEEKVRGLQEELGEWKEEEGARQVLNDVLRKTTARYQEKYHEREKEMKNLLRWGEDLRQELTETQESLKRSQENILIKNNQELLNELNALRVEIEERREEIRALKRFLEKEREEKLKLHETVSSIGNRDTSQEGVVLEEKTTQEKVAPLYRQLKEQFEEKSKQLHEVRKELFAKQLQIDVSSMEAQERLYDPSLLLILRQMDRELSLLEEENRLMREQWGQGKKKEGKKSISEEPPQLCFSFNQNPPTP